MQSVLANFWDSVCPLSENECREKWERIANDYVRPDMAKRFLKDLGSRKEVRARYFGSPPKKLQG